jgi:hypothetical protein
LLTSGHGPRHAFRQTHIRPRPVPSSLTRLDRPKPADGTALAPSKHAFRAKGDWGRGSPNYRGTRKAGPLEGASPARPQRRPSVTLPHIPAERGGLVGRFSAVVTAPSWRWSQPWVREMQSLAHFRLRPAGSPMYTRGSSPARHLGSGAGPRPIAPGPISAPLPNSPSRQRTCRWFVEAPYHGMER